MNKWLKQAGSPVTYRFNFLTPKDYNQFFQKLRDNDLDGFRSKLDAALSKAQAAKQKSACISVAGWFMVER